MTGLTPEQVKETLASDLLLPFEKGLFDQEDIAIGQLLQRGFSVGLSIKDLDYYPRLAKEIAKREMALRMRLVKDLSFEMNVSATIELTRAARAIRNYIFERQFQRSAASQDPSQECSGGKKEVKPLKK